MNQNSPKQSAAPFAQPHITRMAAYQPGEQPAGPGWVKLNTNENPYPPSPLVREAIVDVLGADANALRRYPNPVSATLRQALAGHHGLSAAQVIVGNGADDILNLLLRVYCGPTAAAGMMVPSYSLYGVLAAIQQAPMKKVQFDRSMQLDFGAVADSGAHLFFLTNPNAPTGRGFCPAEVESLLQAFPGVLVVDETYAPFADTDCVGLLRHYPRLVIVRSFSKAYALAGLRVGYALADPAVVQLLDRVRDSYNLDSLAQAGACAALADEAYQRQISAQVLAMRKLADEWYQGWGWFSYPSQANFHFVEPTRPGCPPSPDTAASLFEFLRCGKILVRYFPTHALTRTFLRISLGTEAEMNALRARIELWMKQ